MESNKGSITEAILKASRKAAAIITVAAVIGLSFTACKDKEDEDDGFNIPTAGDGSISFATPLEFMNAFSNSTNITFSHYGKYAFQQKKLLSELSVDPSSAKIENGTLKIQLGTPTEDKLVSAIDYVEGASVTNGLKICEIWSFGNDGNSISWDYAEDYSGECVFFIYANKAGKITYYETGKYEDETWFTKIDLDLKYGWNTAIMYEIYDEKKKYGGAGYYSGKPGSKHKWMY